MTTVARWSVVAVVTLHGLIHVLGAVKAFGWAEVPALREPLGPALGALWLLAAVLVLAAAWFVAAGSPTWWWAVALGGAAASQLAIVTSWSDAKVGTLANVLLVVVAGYGFASVGPTSLTAQWHDKSVVALARSEPTPTLLTEDDLDGLPEPLAAYVRRSGAVGRERVTSLEARFHGRIRSGAEAPWMTFTGRQVNTFGAHPRRVLIMDATRSGLPVTVLHEFADTTATMRAKVLSLVPVVDAAGPVMDRGETVTVFNDLVVLAPGAIVGSAVRWSEVDASHVRGVFTDGGQSVTALLTFDADDDLVDFSSPDRFRASSDGRSFTAEPWSTPIATHQDRGGLRLPVDGEGRWEAAAPEGPFAYIEFHLDGIAHNITQPGAVGEGRLTTTGPSR